MHKSVLLVALLLAGCSKQTPQPLQRAEDMHQATSGPDITPTALPGVALTYDYGFVLPASRIAQVQERHAGDCEALGSARCRIAGMTYYVRGQQVFGTLDFRLAPDLARRFGKQGIAVVVGNRGMLSRAEITSVDAGQTIARADRTSADMGKEIQSIEARLATGRLPSAERVALQQRLQALTDNRRALASEHGDAALLLASTPVRFTYETGSASARMTDNRFVAALKDGWANIVDGTLLILTMLISLLPWLILVAIAILLWRRFVVWRSSDAG